MATLATTPVVTSLRDRGARGVEVHLDGRPWRVIPVSCAAAAGLGVGMALDRQRARTLARALRRERALGVAVRALRHASHSRASLETRLAARGVQADDRAGALDVLARAGLVDDARSAGHRAATLAERGRGDAAIRDDLARRGYADDDVERAVAALEPETERAARIVAARGRSARTARHLAAAGFEEEVVEGAIAGWDDVGLG